MTVMSETILAAYRSNLRRYCQLLATDLTDLEREYLHRRIRETREALERLEAEVLAGRAAVAGPAAAPPAAQVAG